MSDMELERPRLILSSRTRMPSPAPAEPDQRQSCRSRPTRRTRPSRIATRLDEDDYR